MTKYVLVKDLPFAKVGTKVEWIKGSGYLPTLDLRRVGEDEWITLTSVKEEWNKFILNGWAKEFEPREWNIYVKNNGEYVSLCEGFNNIVLETKEKHNWDKIIKVREVIE